MIYVSGGHEKSIGLEVFLKSFLCLSDDDQKKFHLFCNQKTFEENLKFLNLKSINNLKITFIKNKYSQTMQALIEIFEIIKPQDTLFTLPSSKDQFVYNEEQFNGHTEFFRKFFKKTISMFFKHLDTNALLLTDHIALKDIAKFIETKTLQTHIENTLKFLPNIEKIFIAGINPHAGEGGLIGNEDNIITDFVSNSQFSPRTIIGPLSGDTLFFNKHENHLLVYPFHDQGLSAFKAVHGLNGMNISLGLDFLRVSVDHGTAFNLFGKNLADYTGCLNALNFILGKHD